MRNISQTKPQDKPALIGSNARFFGVAQKISQAVGIPFFYEDFRPGFAEGTQTSIDLELYRQPYCGCIFSEEERYSNSFKKKRKKKLKALFNEQNNK